MSFCFYHTNLNYFNMYEFMPFWAHPDQGGSGRANQGQLLLVFKQRSSKYAHKRTNMATE